MRSIGDARELTNTRRDARRRNGNAIRDDVQAVRVAHHAQRFHQRLEIQKGLARAHAYEVRAARRLHAVAVSVIECDDDLFDNFAGGQIAQQAELRRQAESALQRTARLRRETNRVTPLFRNEDSLDGPAVVRLHQVAPRAVGRDVT